MSLPLSCLIGVITSAMLYKLLFQDGRDFIECAKAAFTPDIISILQGKWDEHQWDAMKFFLWLSISIATGILAYVS